MKNTVVIDLDGTLSNCDARRHLVTGKKRFFDEFHARLIDDPVNDWCRALMHGMKKSGAYVVIVSARPSSVMVATNYWLEKHGVIWDELHLLRTPGDSTPDQELKRAWLHRYGSDRVLFVVDDRKKVVDMWRAEGLTVLHCADWVEKSVSQTT